MEEKQHHNSIISMQNDTIYFRFVNHFADPDCVTSLESGDPKGWKKIFNEFGPECLKKAPNISSLTAEIKPFSKV